MINFLKASIIRGADWLNEHHDPFPEFQRPALPKVPKKLSQLEAEFYADLTKNFWRCQGQVLTHRLPLPVGSPLDTGDQAIWHGIYTGVLALRYHLHSNAAQGADTYGHLLNAVKGMELHQTIHGEAKRRLIRGVTDDLKTFQDDASNDSATGHLFGIYFGWKYGPDDLRPMFAELAQGLAEELAAHGHSLVRADGTPTTYGALVSGWKTDPLRLTLALAIYAVAARITPDGEFFGKLFRDLYQEYKGIVSYPKVKFLWVDNSNDTHRAAIHLAILSDLVAGEAYSLFGAGLWRIAQMTRKLGNIWVEALVDWGCSTMRDPEHRATALKVLSEFTLADKQYDPGRDNYKAIQDAKAAGKNLIMWPDGTVWTPVPILWNGTWMAHQPIPRWAARSQDFFWQRNLRSLDVGSDGDPAGSRLNGGDFLAAYWLSRANLTLTESD